MAGQWEVVNRKGKGGGAKKNKNQPKVNQGKALPKMEGTGPIQESQTMFDAFIEKKKNAPVVGKMNGTATVAKHKESNTSQKKKNQDKKKVQPIVKTSSLEDNIKTLNCEEMKNCLATVEARFPDSPVIWLQDLFSYMNIKLDVEVTDLLFSEKPAGYPSCLLSSEIHDLLNSTFARCSTQTLKISFENCLNSMIQDMVKGLNTVGHRIFLQCLSQAMPHIAVENIPKVLDFQHSYQNRQNICLSILWVIGQAGNKDLEAGFKIWLEVMFPLLGIRAYSKYVVDYLEGLTSDSRSTKVDKSVLGVRELFPILDFIHSPAGLAANLQKQLQALYPKIKLLSYGPNPPAILRNYFPSYLRRLESECSTAMKHELLASLVECLAVDKHTYSVWRQLYTKHLVQSSLLIKHLHEEWENLPSVFPRKLLFETLSAFQVTNEELKGHGRANQLQEIENCASECAALMAKMNAQRFPWGKLLFFLTVAVAAILAYDIQQNGSFKKSKTGQLMKDAGLLAICEQAWGKITIYTGKAHNWLQINVPVFTKWMHQTFGPSLRLFWEKLVTLFIYLWNSTEGVRAWANKTIPPILQTVSDNFPIYAKKLSVVTEGIVFGIVNSIQSVTGFLEYYTAITITWLHKNIFTGSLSPENLQRYAGDTVQAFQQYTLTTYNWISKYVATVIYPGK